MTYVLLVGPFGHGGAGIHVQSLQGAPPAGVEYEVSGPFKQSAPGARCLVYQEVLLNRLVHPMLVPDIGFRALRLDERFDLVHVHAYPVRFSGLRDRPVVFSEGSSSVVYAQDYLGWDRERMRKGFRRNRRAFGLLRIHERLPVLKKATRAYVFSQWARSLNAEWGADADKIDVVYPGFPTLVLTPKEPRERFRFLFIGRDFERKGGFELIEAFESVLSRHPEARLTLVTEDFKVRNPDRLVHSWVEDSRRERGFARLAALELRGEIERLPLVSRQVILEEIFPRADAFVMPTHAEGFGFTNIEAMSFGIPVVSSDVGAIPEVVTHGRTGLLYRRVTRAALASAMSGLVADRGLTNDLGTAGRQDFLSRFTIAHSQAAVRAVYDKALGA